MYRNFLKRVIDILGALFLLILTSPIIIATAIFIYFKVSRDVIFTQARPGLNEKIFKIYKFKRRASALLSVIRLVLYFLA